MTVVSTLLDFTVASVFTILYLHDTHVSVAAVTFRVQHD
jgi:hypothetical protein